MGSNAKWKSGQTTSYGWRVSDTVPRVCYPKERRAWEDRSPDYRRLGPFRHFGRVPWESPDPTRPASRGRSPAVAGGSRLRALLVGPRGAVKESIGLSPPSL